MSNQFVGEIRAFGGNFAIVDWAFCQGQLTSISQNPTLYNLIGTTYGGDGQNTFGLPNLKSNIALGQGQSAGTSNWILGQIMGSSNVTLTQAQVPAHTHAATFADGVQFVYELAGPTAATYPSRAVNGDVYTTSNPNAALSAATISTQGGSQPHSNTMPILVMNYIISLFGIYPSQN